MSQENIEIARRGLEQFNRDFSAEELALLPALKLLQGVASNKVRLATFLLGCLWQSPPTADETKLLQRLQLQPPRGFEAGMLRRLVLGALRRVRAGE